jgi:hypothetical protein
MTKTLIRVEGELTDELAGAFPQLLIRHQGPQTMVVGDLEDQEELQGVLRFLGTLGVAVVEVVSIPD